MRREEAKVGMRVYDVELKRKGTIAYINPTFTGGCDVEFDNGEYNWIKYGKIKKLEKENKL